jgi:hypothetical protein
LVAQLPATRVPPLRVDVGDVTAFADARHMALATSLAEAASQPHEWAGIGRTDAGPVVMLLANDASEFGRLSHHQLPNWGAGMALPDRHVIVIRLDAGDPFQTLRHELAHLVLHRAIRGRVPLWFDEGYAVFAAGEYGRLAGLQLDLAVATGRIPELRELDGALRGSSNVAETAYALAGSAVAELAARSDHQRLDSLIRQLARGVPFDAAVETATGFEIDRFERAWERSVRQHYNLGVWLATGGLWLGVTLILAWLAATRRHREAPRRAALDVGWPEPPVDDETITIQAVGPGPT